MGWGCGGGVRHGIMVGAVDEGPWVGWGGVGPSQGQGHLGTQWALVRLPGALSKHTPCTAAQRVLGLAGRALGQGRAGPAWGYGSTLCARLGSRPPWPLRRPGVPLAGAFLRTAMGSTTRPCAGAWPSGPQGDQTPRPNTPAGGLLRQLGLSWTPRPCPGPAGAGGQTGPGGGVGTGLQALEAAGERPGPPHPHPGRRRSPQGPRLKGLGGWGRVGRALRWQPGSRPRSVRSAAGHLCRKGLSQLPPAAGEGRHDPLGFASRSRARAQPSLGQ